MDKIVLYSSKTGFSERYARWLAEDLNCQAIPLRERDRAGWSACGTIILTGGLYAGQMAGLQWFKKQSLPGKRLAAVAVGCSPADFPGLPESMRQLFGGAPQIRGFYCQGGLDYARMGLKDRAMMAALRQFLRHKPDQKAMLEGISHSFDATDRTQLAPVLEWANQG